MCADLLHSRSELLLFHKALRAKIFAFEEYPPRAPWRATPSSKLPAVLGEDAGGTMEEAEREWRCRRVSRRKAEVRQWSPRCWPGGPRREGHTLQLE
jgi:hypothetical protein